MGNYIKDISERIADFEKASPLSLFYEFGISPEQVKESIVLTFDEFFENKDNLIKHAVPHLISAWLSYLTIYKTNPKATQNLAKLNDIITLAKKTNKEAVIEAYKTWLPEISQGVARFWSIYNSQPKLNNLCLDDFLAESLRIIGQLIEGVIKPFLKFILHLNRIKRNRTFIIADIQTTDLGLVVDELINTTDLRELLTLQPHNIRLNQWRNIAYHHNSKIVTGKMILSYKTAGAYKEFSISRDEMLVVLRTIGDVNKLFRIIDIIFCFDNILEIQQTTTDKNEGINYREEARLLDFSTAINSQGFKIKELKYDVHTAVLKVQDEQDYPDFQKRAIHSSQFVYHLWDFTNSKKLIVEYYIHSGRKFLAAEISSDNFINTKASYMSLTSLLKNIQFTFISFKYKQNLNPFDNLKLAQEILNSPQEFYSQIGELISVQEFCKQFILSTFANYLVFKSEGIIPVTINIGSDGSTIVNQGEKKFVFNVPATIKDKKLQAKLIELMSTVLNLYDKGTLQRELVEEAKQNNKYYFKKSVIRNQL